MANKDDAIILEWEVLRVVGWGYYEVQAEGMDLIVKAKPAGKMKMFKIKIIPGDWVQLELNEYDPTMGRIIYRYKKRPPKKQIQPEPDTNDEDESQDEDEPLE